jgi:hypothetical protein
VNSFRWLCVLLCGAGVSWPGAAFPLTASDYAVSASWLCRPDRADVCSSPLSSTVVAPDSGALSKRILSPDPAAPIDCFYVYPTVSREPTANADMAPSPEIQHAAMEQFARFGANCRTFAPIYRQVTTAAMNGEAPRGDGQLAYSDVRAAWRYYLEHDNHGRGVVLVGHSQGASLLQRLITAEIDGKPVQRRLVSAILVGGNLQVPVGRDVGGTFRHIPLCRAAAQTGCVIAYSTYLADHPPGWDGLFGAAGSGTIAACVNPGELTGDGSLDGELPTVGDVATALGTTFVENPSVLSGRCTSEANHVYLAISIRSANPRTQRLASALTALDARRPRWGLHSLDIALTLGNLVDSVRQQSLAWASQASSPKTRPDSRVP